MADEDGRELITVQEARERLSVSKPTMARLLREGHFSIYENPRDRRQKLLDVAEVARGPRPRLVKPGQVAAGKLLAAT